MMKAAEDRLSSELAEPLDGPMARRILFQGQIRSEFDHSHEQIQSKMINVELAS